MAVWGVLAVLMAVLLIGEVFEKDGWSQQATIWTLLCVSFTGQFVITGATGRSRN
jgi:hypothetical protein